MKEDEFDDNNCFEKKPTGKRKHVTLTIQQKLEIINLVEEKVSRQTIASTFGIGKSTVHDIHKRRDQIRMFAEVHDSADINKRRRVDHKSVLRPLTFRPVFREEPNINSDLNEETINSIDEFEYQEISDQEYEIVYDTNLTVEKEESVEQSKNEPFQKSKRPSKTLTFREKYQVIQLVENGASVPSVCESYGIGRTTVYDYMRRKQEIIEFVEKTNDGQRKTFKKSKFPEIEERVLEWCEARETFMKQQFYDCAKAAFDDARDQGCLTNPSGFCGSWSWAKRFFHRHPELKKKLVTANGTPVDPSELSLTNSDCMEETIPYENNRAATISMTKKPIKYLTMEQKNKVLNELDAGQPVQTIADKFEVSKNQIYDIFKRRLEIRDSKLYKLDPDRKMVKRPRYPQLELELLRWCLQQPNFPLSNVLIADKARCLFETLGLIGSFNPSSIWAKKFVLRYPELSEKQGLLEPEVNNEESLHADFKVEQEECEESPETFEFMDTGDLTPVYQEEYIIEELEIEPCEEEEEEEHIVNDENEKYSNFTKVTEEARTEALIPDQIAMKSLKILIKYAGQEGHEDIRHMLSDYQNKLHRDISQKPL